MRTIRRVACGAVLMTLAVQSSAKAADRPALVARPFDLAAVRLLPSRFKENADRAEAYLLSIEADRLLSGFRTEAGLKPKAAKYPGWESEGVAGCVAGHYLSGCALAFASTGDERFRERVRYMIGELVECQTAHGDGYVSAIPGGKRVFAEVARGDIRSKGFDLNGGWVPWYTQHKVMAGLRDAYLYAGDERAKDILVRLADWTNGTVSKLSDEQMQQILRCEQGGMTEVLSDVSAIANDPKYLALAAKFNHRAVLEPLEAGQDKLAGLHANTQIPKIVGAAREYELGGDPALGRAADTFWNAVVGHHTYVTGGNSDGEHFGRPDRLTLGNNTTETCNTYNMLRLTRHLFSWTGDAKYFDFYERAVTNHILGSQNPSTGEVTYYVPLKSGAKRQWQSLYNSFTCCVGTGMENHVQYGNSVYFHDDNTLWVNLFIASELTWKDKGVRVRMESPFPAPGKISLAVDADRPTRLALKVRRPAWAKTFAVTVNGSSVADAPSSSYVTIDREWKSGDRVEIDAPYALSVEPQPGKADQVAILDGPVVLAEKIEGDGFRTSVLVDKSGELLQSIKPDGDQAMTYRTSGLGQPNDFVLRPFYDAWQDRYAVYFNRYTPERWAKQQAEYDAEQQRQREYEARTVDAFAIGEMQPERDHKLTGEKTRASESYGRKCRDADGDGYFEFTMKVDPAATNELVCTYWGGEAPPRTFDVLANGKPLARQVLDNDRPGQFFDVAYKLPRDPAVTEVRVRFNPVGNSMAGGCFGVRTVRVSP